MEVLIIFQQWNQTSWPFCKKGVNCVGHTRTGRNIKPDRERYLQASSDVTISSLFNGMMNYPSRFLPDVTELVEYISWLAHVLINMHECVTSFNRGWESFSYELVVWMRIILEHRLFVSRIIQKSRKSYNHSCTPLTGSVIISVRLMQMLSYRKSLITVLSKPLHWTPARSKPMPAHLKKV